MTKIKLVTKDMDFSIYKPYDWDLIIGTTPYYVIRIPGYVHSIGGRFGDNDYWCYPRGEVPTYDNVIQYDSNYPVRWGIIYTPTIYIKCKWDECTAYNGSKTTITRNGIPFADTSSAGIGYGIDKARCMITEFEDHPLELNSIDFDKKCIGRKIWWRSEHGVIERYINGQANIIIKPDGIDHFTVPAEFREDEDGEYYEDNTVKTSILDTHIWWFRD